MSLNPYPATALCALASLCIDAQEPRRIGEFWAAALRWDVDDSDGDAIRLIPTDSVSFDLVVRRVPYPKSLRNRIHLDLTTSSPDDLEHSAALLLGLGGRHCDVGQRGDEGHVVLADPEGNELCLIEHTNQFLGDCPRLGAVNCDGTRPVGVFWSTMLGWPLVWDQDEETAIRHPDGTGPKITWSGPPLLPKQGVNRLHFEVALLGDSAISDLERHGALRTEAGGDDRRTVLTDPDDNELVVITSTPG